MKFIIGLGNPGKKYSSTRHNVGFAVLDNFTEDKSLEWREYKDCALVSVCDDFILVKSMLFMNRSGYAIMPLIKKYNPDYEDIIVVCDDMDISFGTLRVRKGGSSGGHNGVESIIETLGTNEFCRIRIGIGRPPSNVDAVDFVLSKFTQEEALKMKSVISRASDAVSVFIDSGLQKAMNLFNKRETIL
ncbi:MAG: aminoacyl-tRNA hydrolase [Elusimicrobia bacterium CG06_land_8_20_14_3_00_38_11]|nr:MAG: aminoacyl-tRNA hydrolase [Elusimicrobia bacterium CG06_land_8_20_14_3_00_38_11]